MKKHGASHGIAVIVSTVLAALIADIVRKHVPLVYSAFNRFSQNLVDLMQLPFDSKYVSIMIFATFLATIWGVAFAFLHSD